MNNKLIARIAVVLTLAIAAIGASVAPAAAAPANSSPGACNMLHTSYQGYLGMLGSGNGPGQGQGLANMMALVVSSEEGGCSV